MKRTLLVSLVITAPLFWWLQGEKPKPVAGVEQLQTHTEWMVSLQEQLRVDPNQSELWFQLGHGYLNEEDFDSALTCFDYALRLSEQPSANQMSAKATALYYVEKQRMTPEVEQLLGSALQNDPTNATALSLIANDHFISFRYAEAIDAWTKMLSSSEKGLDRKSVIQSLNQAKEMLN